MDQQQQQPTAPQPPTSHSHSNSHPSTNPPSVETAYKQKCIALKKRLGEIEAENEFARVRNRRGLQYIHKMRLESCILLERLAKVTGMTEDAAAAAVAAGVGAERSVPEDEHEQDQEHEHEHEHEQEQDGDGDGEQNQKKGPRPREESVKSETKRNMNGKGGNNDSITRQLDDETEGSSEEEPTIASKP